MSENKTGKYLKYAVGETLLVVIGILIALQINNWNENRKTHRNEVKLAEQLLEDARADSVFFQSRITHQQIRDTLFNNLINLSKQIAVDSISKIEVNADPFFFRLAYQSNLINNNPDAYDLISHDSVKSKLREYKAKYDYVVHSIELNNRISEEFGLPLQIKYYKQLQMISNQPVIGELKFSIEDEETVAKFDLLKNYGDNYLVQTQSFLKVNLELINLLETYLEENL
jgi:hypothetical protein